MNGATSLLTGRATAFGEELEKQSPCPCDGCQFFQMCRMNRLACKTFKAYCENEVWVEVERRPARKHYNDLFTDFGYCGDRHD